MHGPKQKGPLGGPFLRCFGRGERIRTSDPSVPNRVLYQAEPRPDNLTILLRKKTLGVFFAEV